MSHHLLHRSKLIAASTCSAILGLTLSGCSTTSETFDCKAGQGVGCKSISEVNQLVDQGVNQGSFGSLVGRDANLARDKQPILPLESAPLPASVISGDSLSVERREDKFLSPQHTIIPFSDTQMVHRMPEEYLRVWVAPFQDQQGNLHEGSVIYTVLKPGYWHLKTAAQNTKSSSISAPTDLNLEENE